MTCPAAFHREHATEFSSSGKEPLVTQAGEIVSSSIILKSQFSKFKFTYAAWTSVEPFPGTKDWQF